MILNETPIRTSKNFKANNIEIEDVKIPDTKSKFENRNIYINSEKEKLLCGENIEDSNKLNDIYEDSKLIISELTNDNFELSYGVGKDFNKNLRTYTNQPLRIVSKKDCDVSNIQIDFLFDENNNCLIDNIEIEAEENSSMNLVISYLPKCISEEHLNNSTEEVIQFDSLNDTSEYFHSGIIKIKCKANSDLNVTVVNLLTNYSNNFLNIENCLCENSNLTFNVIDFGGKHSITNYYSSLDEKFANNDLNTIYLGNNDQLFDLNYLAHCKGIQTNINIEVQGALKDKSVKHFKGTIDFKKGCKKSSGNENESCLLLSNEAKSLALPMLLCSEEDVIGNHSSSSGRVDSKELFYLMTRGFSEKDAMRLLVRAKFNNFLEKIDNDDIKKLVLSAIESKL